MVVAHYCVKHSSKHWKACNATTSVFVTVINTIRALPSIKNRETPCTARNHVDSEMALEGAPSASLILTSVKPKRGSKRPTRCLLRKSRSAPDELDETINFLL